MREYQFIYDGGRNRDAEVVYAYDADKAVALAAERLSVQRDTSLIEVRHNGSTVVLLSR